MPALLIEAEVSQQPLSAVAQHGAARTLELVEETRVLGEDSVERIGLGEDLRVPHPRFGLLDALFEPRQVFAARQQLGKQAAAILARVLLLEEGDLHAARER